MRTSHLTLLALAAITAAPMLALAQQDIEREADSLQPGDASERSRRAATQAFRRHRQARIPIGRGLPPFGLEGAGYSRVVAGSRLLEDEPATGSDHAEDPSGIYFNDDVMVGSACEPDVMELSASDDALGTTFYTLDQSGQSPPSSIRQTDSCLLCHGSSHDQGLPGPSGPLRCSPTGRAPRCSPAGRTAPTTPARSMSAGVAVRHGNERDARSPGQPVRPGSRTVGSPSANAAGVNVARPEGSVHHRALPRRRIATSSP